MLKSGILNPHINSLLSRVRHTNTLVIADRGFPFWPEIETVDISLVDNIPGVLDVLRACGRISPSARPGWPKNSGAITTTRYARPLHKRSAGSRWSTSPTWSSKGACPQAIGLIRTADTIQYANIILESA